MTPGGTPPVAPRGLPLARPLISVLLPVHNRPQWVGRAVESVLAQDYPHVELIVIDDGSTDGTPAAIEQLGARLVHLRQARRGPYAARNHGLSHAQGDLIAFIDSDDQWYPDRLLRQLPLLDPPAVGLVFGDAALTDYPGPAPSRGSLTAFDITPPRRGWVTRHFAYGNFVPTSSVLVRRRCLEELGGFQETPPLSADYLMWFRISLRYQLDYVPDPVFEYAVHGDGISRDLVASLRARIALFSLALARAIEPRTRLELRRVLFHLHLSLALACVRLDRRGTLGALADGWRGPTSPPRRKRLGWGLEFVGNQLRVRVRRRWRRAGRPVTRGGAPEARP
jgi:glycosyltransferase involved in cell wall biosynthesis